MSCNNLPIQRHDSLWNFFTIPIQNCIPTVRTTSWNVYPWNKLCCSMYLGSILARNDSPCTKTFIPPNTEYSREIGPMPCLVMTRILVSPGHQQAWYCRYIRYTRHVLVLLEGCVILTLGNYVRLRVNKFKDHDDVIKWEHFPRYWPFCGEFTCRRWIPRKGHWRRALMFSLICARINGWVNNSGACDLRRRRAHYDVIVMRYDDTTRNTNS